MLLQAGCCLLALVSAAGARPLSTGPGQPKPVHTDYARTARWLAHWNTWGVLSTQSRTQPGFPYGSVVSFSDGPGNLSTGRLLFYLTALDAAVGDAEHDSRVSLAVAEAALPGSCTKDPEDPTCSKITVLGRLEPVSKLGVAEARELLFARHPDMRTWPADHDFRMYELQVQHIRLLDWYGGVHEVDVGDYFLAQLFEHSQQQEQLLRWAQSLWRALQRGFSSRREQ